MEGVEAAAGDGGAAEGLGRKRPGAVAGEQQQQKRKQVIRWERFLPRRSLKVLLVEHDDSTRQIVTALLRKCSYHVAAVADGIKAWEVLKEKTYNFDLVLTEVAIPSFSGIDLLSRIMGCELSKNIPVIMMSSDDSVNAVFKCMLKGAVDFLVKPVRKNELRNLWQHVWRRHCSTGYTNGPENINNNPRELEDMSNNNAASNHVSVNAGKESETGESCDEGSDTQMSMSLGSKPVMGIKSSQKHGEPHLVKDGSSYKEMKAKSEQAQHNLTSLATRDGGLTKDKTVGIEVEVTLSIQETSIMEKSKEIQFSDRSLHRKKDQGFSRCNGVNVDPNTFCQIAVPNESSNEVIDFIGSVANGQCSYATLENDIQRESVGCDSPPSWKPSLKRPQPNGCVTQGIQEKHILNHSAASAFSRYGHTGIHLSCQKSRSSSDALCIKTRELDDKCQSYFNHHGTDNEKLAPFSPGGRLTSVGNEHEATPHFQVSSGRNKEDAYPFASGPSGEDALVGESSSKDNMAFAHPQLGLMLLPIPVGAIPFQGFCSGYGPILQPIFYPDSSILQHGSASIQQAKGPCLDQPGNCSNHLVGDLQSMTFHLCEESHRPSHLGLGTRDKQVHMESGNPRDTFFYMERTNQSGSSSHDVLNGSSETADVAADRRSAARSGLHNYNRKGIDHVRSRRNAALIKFRLKRKERCFEKKVRYHSRKMLAEQRPRVKGQFVRQAVVESTPFTTETDD